MQYRRLGGSGLQVSTLGFGAMTFGASGVLEAYGKTEQAEADRLIAVCLEAGVNLFDTAEGYSEGRSEEMLAKALGKRRHEAVIATKAWNGVEGGVNAIGSSRQHIIGACEASLKRMKTDYIDLYQIHCYDTLTPIEETISALDDLVRSGKVRYIGVSNYAGWQMMKAVQLAERKGQNRIVSNQIYYSLIGRDPESEIVPVCLEENIGLVIWGPLAFGLLSGKFKRGKPDPEGSRGIFTGAPAGGIKREELDTVMDLVFEIAETRNASPAQVALNYLLRKPGVTSAFFGARTEAQLLDNLGAASWSLSDEEMQRLDAAYPPRVPYPVWVQRNIFGVRNPAPPSIV